MGMGTLLMHGYGDASKCMGMGTLLNACPSMHKCK